MQTDIVAPDGKVMSLDVPMITKEEAAAINADALSRNKLTALLEKLDISADAKSILLSVGKVTIKVGQSVLSIGRKVITLVLQVASDYPNTAFGVIMGAIMAALIASIPLLGALLSPIATPLLLVLGIGSGLKIDLLGNGLMARIKAVEAEFGALRPTET